MGKAAKGIQKGIGKGLGTVFTGGANLIPGRKNPFRKVGDVVGGALSLNPNMMVNGILGPKPNAPGFQNSASQDPITTLSQTGGAPVLANIAMGADITDSMAGFLGMSKDDVRNIVNGNPNVDISKEDSDAILNVYNQLKSIQDNRQVRQQAVDNLIKDFPNIIGQASAQYGDVYDKNMKGYVDNALNQAGAKFAVGGQGISSGAMNEAAAKVGAEYGRDRLNFSTGLAGQEFNNRLVEANALRDFQNTLLGQTSGQGFSANQAALQRQFQGTMAQNDFANQRYLSDQQNRNALFGALGGLGGTIVGGGLLGAFGSAAASPKVKTPEVNKTPSWSYKGY